MDNVPTNPDSAGTWDKQEHASTLLGDKGGMALWVRRDEGLPRSAVRFGGDIVTCLTELAALQMGLDKITSDIAQVHGIDLVDFKGMVGIAHNELTKHTIEGTSRFMPAR